MPGYHGRLVHTRNMTIAFWKVEKGASVPEHSHFHEQVLYVMEGEFEFTVANQTKVYYPGDIVVIDPNVPHNGTALTACTLLDVFSPPRDDYR